MAPTGEIGNCCGRIKLPYRQAACKKCDARLTAGRDGPEGMRMTTKNDELAMRVWFRLLRLEARMSLSITERLREIGLSVPQCDVLTTLTEAEGVSQQELAKRLYVTKGNISGLLDRLETAGLVERRSTETDRRQYEIYLTPPGREAADKAIALQRAFISRSIGQLPGEDLLALENLLITLRDSIRAGNDEKR